LRSFHSPTVPTYHDMFSAFTEPPVHVSCCPQNVVFVPLYTILQGTTFSMPRHQRTENWKNADMVI